MKKVVYPVLFTKDENNILIEIPDLGITTEAVDEASNEAADDAKALEMARDAIGTYYLEKDDIKEPSSIFDIDLKNGAFYTEDSKCYVSLVDIDIMEYRRKYDNRMKLKIFNVIN